MLKTTVHFGNMFKEIKESIDAHERSVRLKLQSLGGDTKKKMHDVIQTNKKRPQAGEPAKLEDNIDVEFFAEETGWGVGEIAKLNKNAKHWRMTNYGSNNNGLPSMIGVQLPPGVFDPGAGAPDQGSFRAGRFKKGISKDGKSYAPIVTKEIPPMNYIQRTVNFVRREINKLKFGK